MPVPIQCVQEKPLDDFTPTPLTYLDGTTRAAARARVIIVIVVSVNRVVSRMQVWVVVLWLTWVTAPTASKGRVLL